MNKCKLLLTICISLAPLPQAFSFSWSDLWLRADQQGQRLLEKGQADQAAKKFKNKSWQAVSHYRAGNYQAAEQQFLKEDTERGYYNRGNALAHLGDYKQAIAAYEKALAINPENKDAKYNRDLLKQLLKNKKQSKQNQSQKNQQKQADNKQQQDKQQQDKQQQDKQQQDKQQQDKQQQDKQQQDKQQQDKQQQDKQQQQQQAQQNAAKQWLNRIPDDPGGLLRQKFLRDHLRMSRQK